MIEIQAPNRPEVDPKLPKIFLAGSIEMGLAQDWQAQVCEKLKDYICIVYNPRRSDWDSSWKQEEANPNFYEQVNWELDKLDQSDFILMYFDPKTKSPISLLELGLHAYSLEENTQLPKLIVCCPEGFWRKGNVDIVCRRVGIIPTIDLDWAIELLKMHMESYNLS